MLKHLQEQTQWSPSSCKPSRTWHLQTREQLWPRSKVFSVACILVQMAMCSSGGRYAITLCTCVDMHRANCCHITQEHAADFPVLARIMWDIMAILGVSISGKHLFLSSKHTLSDLRSSMTAKSASKTVVVKEWLKKGFRDDVNYLDGFCIQE